MWDPSAKRCNVNMRAWPMWAVPSGSLVAKNNTGSCTTEGVVNLTMCGVFWGEQLTDVGRAEWIFGGKEQHRLMYYCWRSVCRTPGNAVWRATCHPWDLVAFKTLNQSRLTIHRRRTTALLAVVIVTPRIHLTKQSVCKPLPSQRSLLRLTSSGVVQSVCLSVCPSVSLSTHPSKTKPHVHFTYMLPVSVTWSFSDNSDVMYFRDAMLARYMLTLCVRPSVRLSVTSRHCTKMAKRRITQTTPTIR